MVATWIRCQARGRTRCTGAREPAPAVARRHDWPLVRAGTSPPSRAARRCFHRWNPGRDRARKPLLKARRFRWRREVAGLLGPRRSHCQRLPRCEWGFSSAAQRLGTVSGSTSVAPTSSPHDGRFSGTRSLSCTVCARPTPTGECARAGTRVWAAGNGNGRAARPSLHLGDLPGDRCLRFQRRTVISRIEMGFR